MVDYSIGVFANSIHPNKFGSSRNIYYLSKALEKKGCHIIVFCPDNPSNREIDLNKIYVPEKRSHFIPSIIPQSFKVAEKAREMENEFDIFHSNSCFGFPYAHRRNKPFVVHMRSISLKPLKSLNILMSNDFLMALRHHELVYQAIMGVIERYSTKNSDLVFCNSRETSIEAENICKMKPNKIKEVYNGIDTNFFLKGNGENIRKIYGLGNKRVLLCVIRLDVVKGIDRLLSAMKIIVEKRKDIVLLLVGGGKLENDVRNDIIRRGLSKSVILTGHINDDHLADFYSSADLFVYPYSPGTTLLEAMAASKPFVLFYKSKDVPPGVPLERISKKKIGKIIKDDSVAVFAEEIINQLDDNEWLLKQGQKGFLFVNDELSWSNIADEVIQHYEKII